MRSRIRRNIALVATGMSVVLTAPALAQGEAFDSDDADAIVVTARRVEERLQDVPISITVVNQEQITQRNIVNAADLSIYTPSLSTNAKYGPEKASFAIRGFVQDPTTAPSVGVYFADVVAPRGAGSTTSGGGVGIGNLFDLQNVQVLKGPQGTLFGRNTTGGAVLLVPRKPSGDLEGYIEGSLGNYDMRRVQGVLNVPLSDTFKVRMGVDRMKRDGYLKNHSGLGPDALGDTDFVSARLSVVADITPNLENYTIASYSLSDNHGIALRAVGCNRESEGAVARLGCAQIDRQNMRGDGWWDVESSEADPKLRMETWQVINTTTWTASDNLTIKNILSYGEFTETTRSSFYGDNLLDNTGTRTLQLIRLANNAGYHNSSQSTFTEELQLQGSSADGRLDWQAGGYYEESNPLGFSSQLASNSLNCLGPLNDLQCGASSSTQIGDTLIYQTNISRQFQKTWFRSKGVYAQGTYDLTDQLSLTGGLRYTWDSHKHYFAQTGIAFPTENNPVFYCSNTYRLRNADGSAPIFINQNDPSPCFVTYEAKSKKPTWVLDLQYKPINDIMLYAKWARGYRAGGVSAGFIGYESWEPEKVDTYELGAKTTFRNSFAHGYFNVAGFYNDFRDQQIVASLRRATTGPLLGGQAIVNVGKSRIWGIEVDSSATLFDSLRLDVGYTYLNTKVKEIQVPTVPDDLQTIWAQIIPSAAEGSQLALSPKHKLTASATYTLPLDESIGRISFGATWVHTSSQVQSLATLPEFGIFAPTDLVNLNATWADVLGAPVDVSAFVTNLTKAEFPLGTSTSYPSHGYEAQVVNEPRMWGFRLKYRFGN